MPAPRTFGAGSAPNRSRAMMSKLSLPRRPLTARLGGRAREALVLAAWGFAAVSALYLVGQRYSAFATILRPVMAIVTLVCALRIAWMFRTRRADRRHGDRRHDDRRVTHGGGEGPHP